jgi:hypothetical protein
MRGKLQGVSVGGIFTPLRCEASASGPPAEPVNEIGSDIFKYTPPVGKMQIGRGCLAALPRGFAARLGFEKAFLAKKKKIYQ